MKQHTPVVRIVTPAPDSQLGHTPNFKTRLTIDGRTWPVVGYSIDGSDIRGLQRMTITFFADVTVVHPEEQPR